MAMSYVAYGTSSPTTSGSVFNAADRVEEATRRPIDDVATWDEECYGWFEQSEIIAFHLVATQRITQLGGWIRWKIWQWIVSSGEVVDSYQVRLFEDDCLIGQTVISVCSPGWCIFTLIPFHVYFITYNEIMIVRKLTLSTCCVAAAMVWSTIAMLLVMMMMMMMMMMMHMKNVMFNREAL